MIDRQGQQGAPAFACPGGRQSQQGDGIPAAGKSQGDRAVVVPSQPSIQPGEDPGRQTRAVGSAVGRQLHPLAVFIWAARAFCGSEAAGA